MKTLENVTQQLQSLNQTADKISNSNVLLSLKIDGLTQIMSDMRKDNLTALANQREKDREESQSATRIKEATDKSENETTKKMGGFAWPSWLKVGAGASLFSAFGLSLPGILKGLGISLVAGGIGAAILHWFRTGDFTLPTSFNDVSKDIQNAMPDLVDAAVENPKTAAGVTTVLGLGALMTPLGKKVPLFDLGLNIYENLPESLRKLDESKGVLETTATVFGESVKNVTETVGDTVDWIKDLGLNSYELYSGEELKPGTFAYDIKNIDFSKTTEEIADEFTEGLRKISRGDMKVGDFSYSPISEEERKEQTARRIEKRSKKDPNYLKNLEKTRKEIEGEPVDFGKAAKEYNEAVFTPLVAVSDFLTTSVDKMKNWWEGMKSDWEEYKKDPDAFSKKSDMRIQQKIIDLENTRNLEGFQKVLDRNLMNSFDQLQLLKDEETKKNLMNGGGLIVAPQSSNTNVVNNTHNLLAGTPLEIPSTLNKFDDSTWWAPTRYGY